MMRAKNVALDYKPQIEKSVLILWLKSSTLQSFCFEKHADYLFHSECLDKKEIMKRSKEIKYISGKKKILIVILIKVSW